MSLTQGTVLPADEMGDGWIARTSMPSSCWIVLPSRARATAATERDFVAPAGARLLSWSQESKTQTRLANQLRPQSQISIAQPSIFNKIRKIPSFSVLLPLQQNSHRFVQTIVK
jgi:hypothetical protein